MDYLVVANGSCAIEHLELALMTNYKNVPILKNEHDMAGVLLQKKEQNFS